MKFIIIFLCLINSAYATKEIKKKYPLFRQFRSTFNVTFGSMSIAKAALVLGDQEVTNAEKNYAYLLGVVGGMRLADGLYYLFRKSTPEIYLEQGALNPQSKLFKKHLNEARLFERRLRRYRSSVIFVNGIGFFGLYNENPDKNKLSLIPGLGMMCVSAYAFFIKGPAENDYDKYFPNLSFNPVSINQKVVWMPQLNYSF